VEDPADVATLHHLGLILHRLAKNDLAIKFITRAIRGAPLVPAFLSNLAAVWLSLGRPDQAAEPLLRALILAPDYAGAYSNAGNLLRDTAQFDPALTAYRRSVLVNPLYGGALSNFSVVSGLRGQWDQAMDWAKRAVICEPNAATFHYNLATALHRSGKISEAIASYSRALALQADYPDAAANLGVALLANGQFAEGWERYEARWHVSEPTSPLRRFDAPIWRGEEIKGRVLLLHAEQGLGDTIQFCRYATLAAKRARIILEVQRPLVRLLSGLEGVERIIAQGDPLPEFDLHCPLLSLPRAFRTTDQTIPAMVPYLSPEAERVLKWRERLGATGFRIGIAWQGAAKPGEGPGRSVPLPCFEPLSRLPNVRLISLQKNSGLDEIGMLPEGMVVEQLGPDFDSGGDAFLDTAAMMMSLDLVVTIDTSIAHLAGALGRPVWVVLKSVPDWRWMLGRDDSLWYPSMRLFRQTSPGEWRDVLRAVASDIAHLTSRRS
jgi:Flp pilus assembly protein TadD